MAKITHFLKISKLYGNNYNLNRILFYNRLWKVKFFMIKNKFVKYFVVYLHKN